MVNRKADKLFSNRYLSGNNFPTGNRFLEHILVIEFIAHRIDTTQETPAVEFDRYLGTLVASVCDLLTW